jgi:hypothetical protein
MDVVIIWTGLAHGLKTPVGGRCSQQLGMFFGEVTIGCVRRLAAEGGATKLHECGRHIEISLAN